MLSFGRALFFIAAILLFAPASAHAWSDEGHRVIALVAERLLTPAARQRVNALLAADEDALTATDLAARATWADRLRASGPTRERATRQWHGVAVAIDDPDLEAACFGFPALPHATAASDGPARDCVVAKVEQFARELGDPATGEAEKTLAFKYLLSLVGDLHQPLHAADRHDNGGTDVKVLHDGRAVASSLHAYWDSTVVEKLGNDPQVIADALLTGAENETAEWSAGTPRTWALESFAVARDLAYRLPTAMIADQSGTSAIRLDITYEIPAVEAARQQLARAGVRLAVLLNAALR